MKNRQLRVDPLHGSILKNMTLFALPIMGTAFLQVLFNSVDTMVIGRYGTENAMASVGSSASVIGMIVTAFTGLGTGVSILVGAQSGKGDQDGTSELLHSLPLTGFYIGLLVAILANVLAKPILYAIHCPDNLLSDALLYFRIYFWSAPFMMIFTLLASVLQARGASFQPFVIQVSCSGMNLILNLVFVIVFHWNVAGVAIATVISQMASAAAILFYFARIEKEVSLSFQKLRAFHGFGEVLRIGVPSSLTSVLMNLSGVIMQTAINGFPDYVISGNTVSSSIEGLMSIAFVGFSSGSMVFVAQNYASANLQRTRKVQICATLTALIQGEIVGFLIYTFAGFFIGLYTDSAQIAEYAKLRMFYMCLPYGFCGTMNVMSGCVRGLGNTKIPMGIAFISSCLFRIVWICTYARWKGTVDAIYVSYPMCWVLATILYWIAFYVLIKHQKEQ